MSAPRLLIVEDDQDVRVATTAAFSNLGYQVSPAENGAHGLMLVQETEFDVVLLDYKLPDMTGLELHRRIIQQQPGVICVFVTAYATVDMIEAALDAGVRRVLFKPVDMLEIIEAVEELVSHKI